jgi:ATP/maltotriose-dependent transcriptional regulator MalT
MCDSSDLFRMEPLSLREIEILGQICDGLSNREIAAKLSLSLQTIKWYNKQIFAKLGVGSRSQAAAKARQQRLLETTPTVSVKNEPRASHNLPSQLTSFVGRQKEIAEVKEHLKASRLVTLTGPGGTGKTRLDLQVAAELRDSYQDGV